MVLELTDDERLKGRGYVVFTDNFYSSPPLFRELSEEGFGAVGTVRLNRKGVPMSVRSAIHNSEMIVKQRRSRKAEGGNPQVTRKFCTMGFLIAPVSGGKEYFSTSLTCQ